MSNNLLFKFYNIQNFLFPILEETLELSDKHSEFVRVIELMPTEGVFARYDWCGNGCKPADRERIFRGFVAKAVFNIPKTSDLIQRLKVDKTLRALCGYDGIGEIPSESTFSRAFAQFARDGITQGLHAAMIENSVKDKLFGHASMDATAVDGREKPVAKPKKQDAPKAKKIGTQKKRRICLAARSQAYCVATNALTGGQPQGVALSVRCRRQAQQQRAYHPLDRLQTSPRRR